MQTSPRGMRYGIVSVVGGSELWVAEESTEIVWYNISRNCGRDYEPRVGRLACDEIFWYNLTQKGVKKDR